jgi:prefoldin subunit 5
LEQEKTINELQQQKEDDRNYFTWEIRKQYIQIEKLVESIKKVKETLSNIKSKKTKTP